MMTKEERIRKIEQLEEQVNSQYCDILHLQSKVRAMEVYLNELTKVSEKEHEDSIVPSVLKAVREQLINEERNPDIVQFLKT